MDFEVDYVALQPIALQAQTVAIERLPADCSTATYKQTFTHMIPDNEL